MEAIKKIISFITHGVFSIGFIISSGFLIKALYPLAHNSEQTKTFWFFSVGAAICLCSFPFFKNQWLYVFAHESAHWLMAKLFKRKTGRFHISLNGGAVEIENPNLAITLAPYFFPTLCFLTLPLYPILIYWAPPSKWNLKIFFAILGYWGLHHLIHTFRALNKEQPDLLRHGYFFSITLITFSNIMLVTFVYPLFTQDCTGSYEVLISALQSDSLKAWNLLKNLNTPQ